MDEYVELELKYKKTLINFLKKIKEKKKCD